MNPYLLIDMKLGWDLPVPTTYLSACLLISKLKLSNRLRVICALEAAKMSIHIWEKYIIINKQQLSKEKKEAPRKAIEIVEKWLEGKATIEEVKKAVNYAEETAWAIYYKYNTSTYAPNMSALMSVIDVEGSLYERLSTNQSAYIDNLIVKILNCELWWNKCYPLIQKELQDRYDNLRKQISGFV